jgi:hypothetical protein
MFLCYFLALETNTLASNKVGNTELWTQRAVKVHVHKNAVLVVACLGQSAATTFPVV